MHNVSKLLAYTVSLIVLNACSDAKFNSNTKSKDQGGKQSSEHPLSQDASGANSDNTSTENSSQDGQGQQGNSSQDGQGQQGQQGSADNEPAAQAGCNTKARVIDQAKWDALKSQISKVTLSVAGPGVETLNNRVRIVDSAALNQLTVEFELPEIDPYFNDLTLSASIGGKEIWADHAYAKGKQSFSFDFKSIASGLKQSQLMVIGGISPSKCIDWALRSVSFSVPSAGE